MNEATEQALKDYAQLWNKVACRKETESKLKEFFLEHKENMNHPAFLQVFSQQVKLCSESYYLKNKEMCQFFYDLWLKHKGEDNVQAWSFFILIRLGTFEDDYAEILKYNKIIKE